MRSLCAAFVAVVLSAGLHAGSQQQVPVFRSATDVVHVPVSVTVNGRPVVSLGVADFELSDSGVVQEIDDVLSVDVPIDVTLLVDMSGSVSRNAADFFRGVKAIAGFLRDVDRLRVITFATGITEVPSEQWETATGRGVEASALTSLHDALILALIGPSPVGRRQLAVAFTDGLDSISVAGIDSLRQVARQSDVVLHLVLTSPSPSPPQADRPRGGPIALRAPAAAVANMIDIAESTGGRRYFPSLFGNPVVGPFKQAFDDFRAGYLLRYRPSGALMPGWHEISVKLRRPGRHTVTARRGYFQR